MEYSAYIPEYDMRVIHMKTAVIVWFLFLYYWALLHGGIIGPCTLSRLLGTSLATLLRTGGSCGLRPFVTR